MCIRDSSVCVCHQHGIQKTHGRLTGFCNVSHGFNKGIPGLHVGIRCPMVHLSLIHIYPEVNKNKIEYNSFLISDINYIKDDDEENQFKVSLPDKYILSLIHILYKAIWSME